MSYLVYYRPMWFWRSVLFFVGSVGFASLLLSFLGSAWPISSRLLILTIVGLAVTGADRVRNRDSFTSSFDEIARERKGLFEIFAKAYLKAAGSKLHTDIRQNIVDISSMLPPDKLSDIRGWIISQERKWQDIPVWKIADDIYRNKPVQALSGGELQELKEYRRVVAKFWNNSFIQRGWYPIRKRATGDIGSIISTFVLELAHKRHEEKAGYDGGKSGLFRIVRQLV